MDHLVRAIAHYLYGYTYSCFQEIVQNNCKKPNKANHNRQQAGWTRYRSPVLAALAVKKIA